MSEETRGFDALAVAGLLTGCLFIKGGFGDIHECAEYVAGHPIWTHELADEAVWTRLRAAILAQHPDLAEMDAIAEGTTPDNVHEKAAALLARYPDLITLARGGGERTESPLESLARIAPDKPVIAVVTE